MIENKNISENAKYIVKVMQESTPEQLKEIIELLKQILADRQK